MATITGTSSSDSLYGTSGSDKINAGNGNDILYYNLSQNSAPGTADIYTGGAGIDMVVLQFTYAQWNSATNQQQLTDYFNWRANVKTSSVGEISNGQSSDFTFTFGSSTLKIQMMEQLGVMVDGQWLGTGAFSLYSRLAPTANADTVSISEDAVAPVTIDVLKGAGGADTVPDLVRDLSMVGAGPAHGTVTLIDSAANPANWTFQYTVDNAHYQYLAQDETATDSFQYQVTDVNDKTATATVTVTITGVNDLAGISGSAANVFSVTEDAANNTAQGKMTVKDADAGDSYFQPPEKTEGTYGVFSMDASGNYTYTLDNTRTAVQSLRDKEEVKDTFNILSKDSTAETTLEFIVRGTNDKAEIGNARNVQLTEDTNPDANNTLVVTGKIDITDIDTGENKFQTVVQSDTKNLGTLVLQADGNYSYMIDNAKVQYLGEGVERKETFTIMSSDGTPQTITITINGADDNFAPVANKDVLYVTQNFVTLPTSILLANDADQDSSRSQLTVKSITAGEGLFRISPVLSSDGKTFSFDATGLTNDSYGFTYTIQDETQLANIQEGKVTVYTVNRDYLTAAVMDLSSMIYSGAYLVGSSTIKTINAGLGDSVLIGQANVSNLLTGGVKNDNLSVGDGLPITLNVKAATESNTPATNNSELITDIKTNILIGDAENLTNSSGSSDVLSVGDALIINMSAEAFSKADRDISASASATPILKTTLTSNNLFGESSDSMVGSHGGADTLSLGDGLQINISATATASASYYANYSNASSTPKLNISITSNNSYGDSYEMKSLSSGGNDVVSIGDGINITMSAIANPTRYGNPSANSELTLNISNNNLYGDAYRMDDSAGGDDTLSVATNFKIDKTGNGNNQTSITISDNNLYGDAYFMYDSKGGDDTLTGSDLVGSSTYMYGDAYYSFFSFVGGNDKLISGLGNDYMVGDFGGKSDFGKSVTYGKDTFVFTANNGKDIIYDFNDGLDKIELSGITGVTNYFELSSKISSSGSDSVITFGANNTITLIGIATTQLTTIDFSFT